MLFRSPKQTKIKKERVFDEAKGKAKTRLSFEKTDKPPNGKLRHNPLSRPAHVKDRSDSLYLAYMARICSGLEKTVNGLRCAAQTDPKRLTYYTAALNAVKEENANEDRT